MTGPARGVDAHCHVFTDRAVGGTPVVGGAAYPPPPVDVDDFTAHLATVGCDRGVLVQPSAYGTDHGVLVAALRRRPDALRGVACVPAGTAPEELAELHAAGVRGTRVQDGFPGGVPVTDLVAVGDTVAPLGWHVEVWSDLRRHLDWFGDAVRRCPVPVVLDHLGTVPSDVRLADPVLQLVLDLLADDQVWVTLSGVERLLPADVDPAGRGPGGAWAEHVAAVDERVAALVATRPQNLLWASDWPHVGLRGPAPDGAEVRARLARWVPDEALREQVLVDNPVRRYDFPAAG